MELAYERLKLASFLMLNDDQICYQAAITGEIYLKPLDYQKRH